MNLIIILIVLVIFIISIKERNSDFYNQHAKLTKNQTKLYRSLNNIDDKIIHLEKIIESHMQDVPKEDVRLIEDIIEEWIEIQKSHHMDDRSWIRNKNKFNK